MCGDDLPNRICIYQACKEDKGNEMVVEDFGVEGEVYGDKCPGHEEGDETEESTARLVTTGSADFDDILSTFLRLAHADQQKYRTHDWMVFNTKTNPPCTIYHSLNGRLYTYSGMKAYCGMPTVGNMACCQKLAPPLMAVKA
jgi:hypothetical protein